ncbi:PhnD/SsuA/transferrin family substrate-binding protein [Mesoplasma seiffertii]|uniref:PhnD/SsuA/transferrin family substrate-binding protein n=1 Tax=Mesoplasma seiffertii TaxID=28224 RepID=UPI00068808C8|nr:PhnD/SsuA/transferrin family substrate-binding protein [Mesoplasma seiffertii]
MKKLLAIIGTASLTATMSATIVSCKGPDELKIVFIPSKNSVGLLETVRPIENKLQAELEQRYQKNQQQFKKKVKVSVSTSPEAAGQALEAGKAHIAFLPVGTYNTYKGKPIDGSNSFDKVGVLLQSSRAGVNTEIKYFENNHNQKAEINSKDSWEVAKQYNQDMAVKSGDTFSREKWRKKYQSEDKTQDASYYRSYIFANNEFLKSKEYDLNNFKNETEYVEATKELLLNNDFTLAKSRTSSAGSLYPLIWMKSTLGMSNDEIQKVFKNSKTQNDYLDAALKTSTNALQFGTGFADIRYDNLTEEQSEQAFSKTQVIGISNAIINDGIMYSKKALNDQELIYNLRESFKTLISKSENSKIFDVYNHTGYVGPQSQEASKEWENTLDKNITETQKQAEDMADLIKSWI